MNDEAAESRGPSGPSQDGPAPSVPATPDAGAPSETAAAGPAAKPRPAERPTTELPTTEPSTTELPTTEPSTTELPTTEPSTTALPAAEPTSAAETTNAAEPNNAAETTSATEPNDAAETTSAAEPNDAAETTSAAGSTTPAARASAAGPATATDAGTEAATGAAGAPAADVPPPWTPPAGGIPEADEPAAAAPPPGGPPPHATNVPPWMGNLGGAGFARDKLVRPRQGRYVAGVCSALARATNTDPVLWRVLIAVLGILSGVGVLIYLIGWLAIPAEGDTASPIESLLGKGRSGMAPPSVVLLGAAAVLSFAFIVHDGMRASVLAAAVILGAVLLIKRSGGSQPGDAAAFPAAAGAGDPPGPVPPAGAAPAATAQFTAPTFGAPSPGAPAAEPVTAPLPPEPPNYTAPGYAPPVGGYRPPFAPHGPWGPTTAEPPQPPQPPRPPRRPRERSKLGRLTFFAVVVVIGLMVVLRMAGAHIAVSAYFAAALVTIALGLIVGAWFGRARGLIALALLCCLGLGLSTGAEHFGSQVGNSVYRPATLAAVADRYDFAAGNATLDLRAVDFTGQQQTVTATMRIGRLRVLLPPAVDTTATVRLNNGQAVVLGKKMNDHDVDGTTVTDLGTDGAGGGTLKLDLQMDLGSMEVSR